MSSHWILRGLAATAAAVIGVSFATSSGAPFLAALLALMAGIIALALLVVPLRAEPLPEQPSEVATRSALPKTGDIINAVDYPILIVRDRRVLLANEAARDTLGTHIEGVDVRLAIRHPAAAERLLDESTREASRTELVGIGDREKPWEMMISPLPGGSRLVRLVDRSDMLAAEQMRVDFVANASHELRTPLATLIGFAETLQDPDTGKDEATRSRFLKIMSDEARRMQQLVDDLISLSRIEAERFSAPRETVDLLPLVEAVRVGCAPQMEERRATLLVEDGSVPPLVLGDRAQLHQLLHNLVSNAFKYGPTGGEVIVRFEPAGDEMLQLSVIDHGEGIAPEHLPRLTERFYRVDPGRSRSMGGTGLGLAIVKHIVGRHRGRLDIRSKIGEGTEVRVYLPRAPEPLSSKSHERVTEVTCKRSTGDMGSV